MIRLVHRTNRIAAYPFGYTLSCDFLRSPNTQIALSTLHREQGLDPSHLLFLRRHLSQALQTRFRILLSPGDDGSSGVIVLLPMAVKCGSKSEWLEEVERKQWGLVREIEAQKSPK